MSQERSRESGVWSRGPKGPGDSPALPPGFVIVDSPREFRDTNALVVRLPRGIRSKQKVFAIFADKLRFPRYFGWNWDAFEELLRDLSWLPAERPVVIIHEDLPFGAGGENRAIYLDVLTEVIAFWARSQRDRMQAVFPGEPSRVLG